MKHIDFEFNGTTYAFSFTAEALFAVYDKFGYTGDILGATKITEQTSEGWKNLCWMAALLASQGELQRRNRGETPQPMVTMEQLRTGFMAAEAVRLKKAVCEALDGLPAAKVHCSVLAEEAIKSALKDYYDRNGIAYDKALFPDCDNCAHCH